MSAHLLEVEGLSVTFDTAAGPVHAVRDVSFDVDPGETLAVLGESGSGKSVSASAVMEILDCPPGHIERGAIRLEGHDLMRMSTAERRRINGKRVAMIFQDTLAHLNPVYSVGWQIAEAIRVHRPMAATALSTGRWPPPRFAPRPSASWTGSVSPMPRPAPATTRTSSLAASVSG